MAETKGGYTRERVRLTAAHLKKAAAMIASGSVEGRGIEWADEGCQGLTLRITRSAGSWSNWRRLSAPGATR
jgi:hypothetical protein